jgi:hypothetical protein
MDVYRFSYGSVQSLESLYDPRTFGPTHDYRCECQKYTGRQYAGRICDRCGVLVAIDCAQERRQRLGKIEFPRPCPHPLDGSCKLSAFPIAPIAFRLDQDGTVNALGKKYERLVTCALALEAQLPPKADAQAYYTALLSLDIAELTHSMAEIMGVSSGPTDDTSSLLPMIAQSIRTLDPNLHTLLRCCALVCDITTSI